jgi:hypothetical protein
MPTFFATYDLRETRPDPHEKFIENAGRFGWTTLIWGATAKKWYKLPNTTLTGDFDDRPAAVTALKAARTATASDLGQCVLEKWIVITSGGSTFESDEKYDPT